MILFTPGGAIFNLGPPPQKRGCWSVTPLWRICAIVLSGIPPGYESGDEPPRLPLHLSLAASYSGGGASDEKGEEEESAWVIIVLSTFIKPLRGKAKEWQTNILRCHRRHKTPRHNKAGHLGWDKRAAAPPPFGTRRYLHASGRWRSGRWWGRLVSVGPQLRLCQAMTTTSSGGKGTTRRPGVFNAF